MSAEYEYSYHVFDEREFRARFLPAVQGDEVIVREMLEAANAAGPSWTALHKMFEETATSWRMAVEAADGEAAQRSLFASFARMIAHLRPAYVVKGCGLSLIDRAAFPELTAHVKSPAALLREGDGPAAGVPAEILPRVPSTCLPGRSGGGLILAADVRPFLKRFRADMPRLREWLLDRGHPAEDLLTILLSAVVDAKLKGAALFEGSNCLVGDTHLSKSHRLRFAKPAGLPVAVVREVGKLFGREEKPEPKPAPKPPAPTLPYSPQGTYEIGQRLEHKSFGEGQVVGILDSRRLKVQFPDAERTLAQNLPRPNRPPAEG